MRRGTPRHGRLVSSILIVSLILVPLCALASTLFAGFMRRRSLGQTIRPLGPQSHAGKAGTPTMGGSVVFVLWLAAVGALFVWHPPTPMTAFVLVAASSFAAIGAADDVISIRRKRSLGLSGPWKLILSSVVTVILFFAFRDLLSVPIRIPFSPNSLVLPSVAVFFLVWIVFLATTNGMNLTDGLDGLAAGVAVLILAGILLLGPSRANLVLIVPLIAGLAGFLWIGAHPAGLFLGDVGSFFLGGTIAALCLANGLAFLLPILAGVLVLEVGSVILQVASLKATGKRLFRMSPLHHHFEISSGQEREHILPSFRWAESKVTVRFWILQGALVGLALLAGKV